MTDIRRYFRPGNIYFLTNVTHERIPILVDNSDLLWQALQPVNSKLPFDIMAWVVLPDHFHLVIDPIKNDLSGFMKRVKLSFSTNYRKRIDARSGRVWQYRFWDHIIRDQADFNRHVDYIHYNPVKHGLAKSPFEWEHSSIHKYFKEEYYSDDWGMREPLEIEGTFGE